MADNPSLLRPFLSLDGGMIKEGGTSAQKLQRFLFFCFTVLQKLRFIRYIYMLENRGFIAIGVGSTLAYNGKLSFPLCLPTVLFFGVFTDPQLF